VQHSLATAANDFLVASGPSSFVKKTLSETKSILGVDNLGSTYVSHSLATAENDFLVASGSGAFAKKSLTETKSILGIQSGSSEMSFWMEMPGTPTRTSNTQFTIADTNNSNKYDKVFTKGVILCWNYSEFNTAMVTSSYYASNTVTINIVGNTLSSGFSSMKYCIHPAMHLDFIIPGTIGTELISVGRIMLSAI